MNDDELQNVTNLRHEIEELKRENDRLAEILGLKSSGTSERREVSPSDPTELESPLIRVDRTSSSESKVAFFQSLFVCRDDVYALRWENARTGKHGWSPAPCRFIASIPILT